MSFKIKKEQALNKTIHMPESLICELEKMASAKDITFAYVVMQYCEYAVKKTVTLLKK